MPQQYTDYITQEHAKDYLRMHQQMYPRTNQVGPYQMIDGSRDVTDNDRAFMRLQHLKSANSFKKMTTPIEPKSPYQKYYWACLTVALAMLAGAIYYEISQKREAATFHPKTDSLNVMQQGRIK
jgi:hypothetical protein